MNILANRSKSNEDILKGKFIRKQLQETAQSIQQDSSKAMSSFRSGFWNDRSFNVTDNVLDYKHLKQHRYVDMRTRAKKDGSKVKKKSYRNHNRIIMGNYSQLVRELSFGFTKETKNILSNIH
ncbi:hypothetical protein [uncultured Flavobacterium sp.]|jgi:hypothetical protein|uniref:hypothetical protein n=1 Tax=uncultured Flavobacterium sp. TaxID=165435 RepID=UPI0030ECE312